MNESGVPMSLFDLDNWQEIFHTLKKNKLRSLMTAFGVFWGLFMLVIMLGTGAGLKNGVTSDFDDFVTNSVFIWGKRTTVPYRGFPRGRRIRFVNRDIENLRQNIPEIAYMTPRLRHNEAVTYQGVSEEFEINGDYPDVQHIQLLNIINGRFLNELDIQDKRKIAIIGRRVQNTLFGRTNPIGEYIQIRGVFFQVVGVFKVNQTGEDATETEESIFIPFSTLQQVFNHGDRVGWFSLTSIEGVPVSIVEEKAIALLSRNHQVAPHDKRAIGHWNAEAEFNKVMNIFVGVNALVWFVGVSTLVAGVIGVGNIMLIVVKERTKEIGIRRAMGASPWSIIQQILLETIFMTSISGYLGLLSGVALIETVSTFTQEGFAGSQMFRNPEVDLQVVLTALVILVISGALAGIIPAQRAISIKPVDAIRSEEAN